MYSNIFCILSLFIGLHVLQAINNEEVLSVNVEFLYDEGVTIDHHEEGDIPSFIETIVNHATMLLKRPGLNMNIDLHVVKEKQVMAENQTPHCGYEAPGNDTVDLNQVQLTVVLIYNSSVIKKNGSWENLVTARGEGLCNPGKSCAEIYWNGHMEKSGHNIARALVMSLGAGKDGMLNDTPCNQSNSIMQINSTIDNNSVWSNCTVEVVQDYIKRNNGICIKKENQREDKSQDKIQDTKQTSNREKREDFGDDNTNSGEEVTDEPQTYVINLNANINVDLNK